MQEVNAGTFMPPHSMQVQDVGDTPSRWSSRRRKTGRRSWSFSTAMSAAITTTTENGRPT